MADVIEYARISTDFAPKTFIPVLLGMVLTVIIWQFFVPRSLRRIQIAFETGEDDDGDGLSDTYEVHRISDSVEDARKLLGSKGAGFGILMYIFAIMGVLILSMDILLNPQTRNIYILGIVSILLGIPIMISPIASLVVQLTGKVGTKRSEMEATKKKTRILMVVSAVAIFGATFFMRTYLVSLDLEADQILAWTMLVLLLPSIVAYGRIMGAGWNAIVHSKWHRANGRASTLHPHAPGFIGKILALMIFFNTAMMPITAINGVFSWYAQNSVLGDLFTHSDAVKGLDNYQARSLMGEGGVLGFYFVEFSVYIQDYDLREFLTGTVVLFLLMNVTIMGLAFVYEVARLLFLGISQIAGRGGLALADSRSLRTDSRQQARVISYCYTGFAGYTVLLLIISMFSRFNQFMPNPAACSNMLGSDKRFLCPAFEPQVLEQLTWTLAVAGQLIFLIFWLISLPRFGRLLKTNFDINAVEIRNSKIELGGNMKIENVLKSRTTKDLMQNLRMDDLAMVRESISELLDTDDARSRTERTQTIMLLAAMQGKWIDAEDKATSLLAQSQGHDDLARKVMVASSIAQRDLKESLLRLEDIEDSDSEVELLEWITNLMQVEPSKGKFDESSPVSNTPGGRRILDLLDRFPTWHPWSRKEFSVESPVDRISFLSDIALLRIYGYSQHALESLEAMPRTVIEGWARIEVTKALLHLDIGEKDKAVMIHNSLLKSHASHPTVAGLSEVLRTEGLIPKNINNRREEWLPEVILATRKPSLIEWGKMVDQLPTNAVAASRLGKKGQDEMLVSNAWLTGSKAVSGTYLPKAGSMFSGGTSMRIFQLLISVWLIYVSYVVKDLSNLRVFGILGLVSFPLVWQRSNQKRKFVRHRNMPAMKKLARKLRRKKAIVGYEDLPKGTHLILKGLVVPIGGIPIDLGFPIWVDPLSPKRRKLLPRLDIHGTKVKQIKNELKRLASKPRKNFMGRTSVSRTDLGMDTKVKRPGKMQAPKGAGVSASVTEVTTWAGSKNARNNVRKTLLRPSQRAPKMDDCMQFSRG